MPIDSKASKKNNCCPNAFGNVFAVSRIFGEMCQIPPITNLALEQFNDTQHFHLLQLKSSDGQICAKICETTTN